MAKREEVGKLLSNMKASAEPRPAKRPDQGQSRPEQNEHSESDPLHRELDLRAYKEHQAWPGRTYLLVGNSFNAGRKKNDGAYNKRRAAAINKVLEAGKHPARHQCVSAQEALKQQAFVKVLSRFEYDWLRRQAPGALLGPAYDQAGKRLNSSFAVWRVNHSQSALKAPARSKQLIAAR
ncbi:MAG: hypothetical protein KGS72_06815 [Cyanobacteria bacterium REEB67]|nr:hypothetical protein [Cyanobacteria bacterium REEB67]